MTAATDTSGHDQVVRSLAERARVASAALASAATAAKNGVLRWVAQELRGPALAPVLDANARDLSEGRQRGLTQAMLDRLSLNESRLGSVADGLEQVAELPDPIGEITGMRQLENGLLAGRMRVPLGVILLIYEARPNVTADAAALCLKSGNACILRGGKEAFQSNQALARLFERGLREQGLPEAAVTLVPTTDRSALQALLGLEGLIDLAIPRGGEELVRFVAAHARVPVVGHYKGVCHVYVHGDADPRLAIAIVLNAKVQRPAVCNAMETLLVDAACAHELLPRVAQALREHAVQLRCDPRAAEIIGSAKAARSQDWDTEYLDRTLSIAVVDGIDAALDHVKRHGSRHTEAIVTRSYACAQRWLREVDASMVLVNASTRFNDGFELGLGAEMGIATTKVHAYGPMGLAELTASKWIAYGAGQVRT